MHLQRLDRVSAPHHSASRNALQDALRALRWRLGFERLARISVRGFIGSSLAVIGLSLAFWLTQVDATFLWAGAAPLIAAVVYGLVRWPSRRETALVVDRRLGLEERLATAVELAEGQRRSRFSELQLQDALQQAPGLRTGWLDLDSRVRNQAIVALGAAILAAVVVVLAPRIPRPAVDSAPGDAASISDVAPAAADELAQRALPLDVSDAALTTPVRTTAAAANPDLAARVQQEQAERSALETLAQALETISAGQPIASAIQQGDFNAARDQLQNLADDADQLTEAAKQQLARGLQQAATSTAQSDKALGTREQQAAQALSRSNYTEQRRALSALADQVQRSGAQSVPSDQLEREVGQLQQQSGAAAQNSASRASSRGAAQLAANQAGAGQASGDPTGAGAQAQGASTSGQNGNGAGDRNGAGIGTGTDPNLYSDKPSRLDSTGQQVQVPLKLGNGASVRPADGTEDQSVRDPGLGGRRISETAQTQQTGQIAPEQNLVPGEQRPVVRGYFR